MILSQYKQYIHSAYGQYLAFTSIRSHFSIIDHLSKVLFVIKCDFFVWKKPSIKSRSGWNKSCLSWTNINETRFCFELNKLETHIFPMVFYGNDKWTHIHASLHNTWGTEFLCVCVYVGGAIDACILCLPVLGGSMLIAVLPFVATSCQPT